MIDKVDFFIIGAQKAATTSLYNYLNEHPDVYMPEVKEILFFVEDRIYNKGLDYFHRFYKSYSGQKIAGGAYVHMLSSLEAPERVYKYNSDAKFLVMLRNPIDRAYSAYHFAIKNGWESSNINFFDSIKLQNERLSGNLTEKTDLCYIHSSLYATHLLTWFKYFDKSRFLILFDADFVKDTKEQLQKVFKFLGISEYDKINTNRVYNQSGEVRFKALHHFLRNKESKFKQNLGKVLPFGVKSFYRHRILASIDKLNKTEKKYQPLSFKEREILFKYFEDDLKELSVLVNRDVYNLWKPAFKNNQDENKTQFSIQAD